ncbi:MAG: BLUF domain-containing protein [Kiritimatiellia bacterium]
MVIVQLIYVSKIKTGHGPNDVLKIVDVSEKNNKKRGITGALCYGPRYFLQCLEGPREEVNKLYNMIVADPRHTDVTLLSFFEIEERMFSEWAMAYVRADEVTEQIVLRFGPSKRFDPYGFSSEQAVRFLQAVVEKHQRAIESKISRT